MKLLSLQPVHQRNGDVSASDENKSMDEEAMFSDDHVLFGSDDEESQSEDDGWFDQLVADNLSSGLETSGDIFSGSLPPDLLDESQVLPPMGDVEMVELDTQIRNDETFNLLDTPVTAPQYLAKSEVDAPFVRPVARPLTSEEPLPDQTSLPEIEDNQHQTPTRTPAKTVIESVSSSPEPSPAQPPQAKPVPDHLPDDSRDKRIAELKAQIALLESQRTGVKTMCGLGTPGG